MKTLWERLCAELRGERGDPQDQWNARATLRHLADFAGIWSPDDQFPPYNHGTKWQLLGALMRSHSRYAAFLITDLFGMEDRFNVPGVLDERNWRTRLPWNVESLLNAPEFLAEAEILRNICRETERQP